MKLQLLLFGIIADVLKTSSTQITVLKNCTVGSFKEILQEKHPELKNISSYAIAVNEAYAEDTLVLQENDIVALIPPVSGG